MSNGAYDPQATEEEAASRSQYFSWKDIRVLGALVVIFGLCLYPVYTYGKKKSEKAQCVNNFKAMFDAVGLYMRDHDEGLPPAYRTDNQNLPALGATGLPYTWASDVSVYMSKRASFNCPSAKPGEIASVEDPSDGKNKIQTSYGFYYAYNAVKSFNIESPSSTILISETSNRGSETSYNPLPYGNNLDDGFIIGWSNSNIIGDANAQSVTRLAFRNTSTGNFKDGSGRHDEGIHALTGDGSRIILKSPEAGVRIQDGLPTGYWKVPARQGR